MINNTIKSISYLIFIAVLMPIIGLLGQNYHQQTYPNYQSQMPGADPNHSTDTYNELLRKAGKTPQLPQNSYTPRTFQQGGYYQQGGNYYQQVPQQNYNTNTNYRTLRQQYYQNQVQPQQQQDAQMQQLQQQQQLQQPQ